MSSPDPRTLTLSPGLVSTSSDEVERVLSALMARREPLAALLAGGADSRWKLRSIDPMRLYIEFPASDPALVTEEGTRAIRMGFPKVTVSRQQRAHPRAPVPLDLPVHCAIPAGAGVALEGQIMDISEGGLALLVRGAYLVPAPGTLIRGWQIERPGKSSVSVDLEVRHCRPLALADGASAQRWGCQFVDPSAEVKELMRLFASE